MTDAPDLSGVSRLTHHRWVIPLLAAIGGGQRFAVLQSDLDVARQTLQRALHAADELGLVLRNPGYGHPLRPEYLLSPDGEKLRPICLRVLRQVRRLQGEELVARKWVLPVLACLAARGPAHFAELQEQMAPITPAALTRTLEVLVEAGWVERAAVGGRPGRTPYRLARRGRSLARAALDLVG